MSAASLRVAGVLALLLAPRCAAAQEADIAFERPGLAFSTQSLPPGMFAWEQGLPDVAISHDRGVGTREFDADALLRAGLGHGLELQLATTPWSLQRTRDATGTTHVRGHGETALGVKWSLPSASQRWQAAILASVRVQAPAAAFDDAGSAGQLAMTLHRQWAHGDTSLQLARDWQAGQGGWEASASYGVPLGDNAGAYVEVGIGSGVAHARVAGGGITRSLTAGRVQLDAWLLRGLDARTPDWQGGVGMSFAFGHARR